LLLKDIQFSSSCKHGLEFGGRFNECGAARAYRLICKGKGGRTFIALMIHDNDGPYISFVLFSEVSGRIHAAPYTNVVNEGFSSAGD